MPKLKNDRLIKALLREPVDMTPIWIMRQAGRYLPEYRAARERAGSFMKLCKTPELACEVTLQPLNRFPLDAAIIFSDILTIPDAMGLGLQFVEGEGPIFEHPLRHEKEIKKLSPPQFEDLNYVYEAIQLVQKSLDQRLPLIGFCGSPWTLAAYMIEGKSTPGFPQAIKMLNEAPFLLHHLLDILAKAITQHLNAQIKAGANVLMIFDTWGGLLNTSNYEEFSLYYIKEITANLLKQHNNANIPLILFTKGGSQWLPQMMESGCDAIQLDWEISLEVARVKTKGKVALQGNMDPACLLKSPDAICTEAKRVLESYGAYAGHVFNLGHGITPDVPPEHVAVLVETVHEQSKIYHAEQALIK